MNNVKPLRPLQLVALKQIAMGTPDYQVAAMLNVSVMTIYRWKRLPEFQSRLSAIAASGLEEIAQKINAAALTAVENIQAILCDMALPTATQIKLSLGVLNAMPALNAALEKGLRHRAADFDPGERWTGPYTYDSTNRDQCRSIEI